MNPPLPVELLCTDDQRRLESSPLDECQAFTCRPKRRVTVEDNHRFREAMAQIQKPKPGERP